MCVVQQVVGFRLNYIRSKLKLCCRTSNFFITRLKGNSNRKLSAQTQKVPIYLFSLGLRHDPNTHDVWGCNYLLQWSVSTVLLSYYDNENLFFFLLRIATWLSRLLSTKRRRQWSEATKTSKWNWNTRSYRGKQKQTIFLLGLSDFASLKPYSNHTQRLNKCLKRKKDRPRNNIVTSKLAKQAGKRNLCTQYQCCIDAFVIHKFTNLLPGKKHTREL